MLRSCVLLVVLSTATAQVALATSYAPVRRHDEPAPSGAFLLDVNAESNEHVVYAVDRMTSKRKRLWSFFRDLGIEKLYLSNDGSHVAVVGWHFIRVGQINNSAFELWNRSGLQKRYTIKDLVARPSRVRGWGPIGGFWRRWRSTRPIRRGDQLEIETTGTFGYTLSLRTGAIDRRWLVASGVATKVVGHGLQLGALLWLLLARRRLSGVVGPQRKNLVLSLIAPLLSLFAAGVHIAGLPLLPPLVTYVLFLALSVAWLAAVPVAVAAMLRGRRESDSARSPTLRLVVATALLPLCHLAYMFRW